MGSFNWSFGVVDYVSPWIQNRTPTGDKIAPDTLIAVDVLDDYSGINIATLDAYVNGNLAFSGPNTFLYPYAGIDSYVGTAIVDGYDGYHLVLDNVLEFISGGEYTVRIVCSDNYGNSLDTSWEFAIMDYIYPWVQDQAPIGENISPAALITANILDDYSGIDAYSLDAYVSGNLVFSGPNTFYWPFNGPSSALTAVNVDGYDGYHLVLDNVGQFPSAVEYTTRIVCSDYYGNSVDFDWSFRVEDYVSPFLRNLSPGVDESGVNTATLIELDILDDYSGINLATFDAYVDGNLAFSGPNSFIVPYNGPSSGIASVIVDGYNGYHLVLDNTSTFGISTNHTVRIICDDNYGNTVDYSWIFHIHSAVQSIVQGPYEITFDVSFSGAMKEDAELIAPANYVFDNGAYTRKVEILAPNIVRLWAELVYGEPTYTVTVFNVTDAYDGTMPSGYSTVSVSPFISGASLANTNGMVRTWRESNLVHADTFRAYLSGDRGIDVFRKIDGTTYNRWGQIFDAYGVGAMYVANFPGDLSISDSSAPYLCDQVPAQSGFASPDTEIQFTIADDSSATEIPEVTIYINGNVIFRGSYGGWQNNYNGIIEIDHQDLNVTLYPPSDFVIGSLVVVRVTATDLLGNSMDSTYSFTIASPISEGFGISEFGWSSFGGISL